MFPPDPPTSHLASSDADAGVDGGDDAPQVRVDRLTSRGRALAAQIAALQSELAAVAGELVVLQDQLNGCTARAWMAWQWGLTPAEAARCARAGERLAELPAVRAAFAEGRLSEGVVDALVKVATPANEAELLDTAAVATGAQLQSLLRAYKKVRDGDDDDEPPEEWQRRWTDGQGMWRANLCLTPEHGADLEAALAIARERCIDEERAARRTDEEPSDPDSNPNHTTSTNADADAKPTSSANSTNPRSNADPRPTGSNPDPDWASTATDADPNASTPYLDGQLERPAPVPRPGSPPSPPIRVPETTPWIRLAHDQLAGATNADGALPERFLTIIHVDEDTLAGHPTGAPHIAGIGAIDVSTALRLLVQSWITVVVERRGKPVTVTEPTRLATPAQRRALLARDPTCRFPGCGRTRRLRAHHIVFAVNHGPTAMWNLLHLCDEHHLWVHEKGYSLTASPSTEPVWRDPRGRAIDPGARRMTAPAPHTDPPAVAPRPNAVVDPLTAFATSVVVERWLLADGRPATAA